MDGHLDERNQAFLTLDFGQGPLDFEVDTGFAGTLVVDEGGRFMQSISQTERGFSRRAFVTVAAAACAGGGAAVSRSLGQEPQSTTNVPPEDYRIRKGRIKQSVYGWCFNPMPTETLIDACHRMGVKAMDVGWARQSWVYRTLQFAPPSEEEISRCLSAPSPMDA